MIPFVVGYLPSVVGSRIPSSTRDMVYFAGLVGNHTWHRVCRQHAGDRTSCLVSLGTQNGLEVCAGIHIMLSCYCGITLSRLASLTGIMPASLQFRRLASLVHNFGTSFAGRTWILLLPTFPTPLCCQLQRWKTTSSLLRCSCLLM
jgi:hypothetical protein